jgi:ferritin-like metal-binding protein YciE
MESNTQTNRSSILEQFFVNCLQELYWSERNLVQVLDTMNSAASAEDLKEVFVVHKEETEKHVQRLEEVFALLDLPPEPRFCVGLQGLFDEGWKVIDETQENSPQRDVALIIAAQKVEHYEIATYGSLLTLAKTMGAKQIATILAPTLEEEKEADKTLSAIAEGGLNKEATQDQRV